MATLLRDRDGHHARVTNEELFFDLAYAFAVTQISQLILHDLSVTGLARALVLWFAVWLGWQYTCWVTNWFDPEAPRIRGMLFAVMLAALIMAAAIPEAFGKRVFVFACAYVTMQVGRTAYIAWELRDDHPLSANYRRMLGWVSIAAIFWLWGVFLSQEWRLACWLLAVCCEYVSPMFGFALPRLGRSQTRDWTIEGGHLAERCQLFVIVALGESLLATGGVLTSTSSWNAEIMVAAIATFLETIAMWWLYFGISSRDATVRITSSGDPGRIGANFHYVHAIIVGGIIATAVGNDLVMAHHHAQATHVYAAALCGGPLIYLLGSAIYKRVVYRVWPVSHLVSSVAIVALFMAARWLDLLQVSSLATMVLLVAGLKERRVRRSSGPLVVEH